MTILEVILGDITGFQGDAIVNAANPTLLGGGGVDGAIHAAAGSELLAACQALPEIEPGVRCSTGGARITPGFRLKARWVIHAVGPVWRGGSQSEEALLSSAYCCALELARVHSVRTIALPAISTGVYGYPSPLAARVAAEACAGFARDGRFFDRIVLVAFREVDRVCLSESVAEAMRDGGR